MAGYTKLFSDIIGSSIWDESDKVRLVWITMLAMKDRHHVVRCTERSLGLFSRVSPEDCRKALEVLSSPDPDSKSREYAGKRIDAVEGGWLILNGEKYAQMLTLEERREYNRQKQAEYRKRKKEINEAGKINGARKAINEGLAQ